MSEEALKVIEKSICQSWHEFGHKQGDWLVVLRKLQTMKDMGLALFMGMTTSDSVLVDEVTEMSHFLFNIALIIYHEDHNGH